MSVGAHHGEDTARCTQLAIGGSRGPEMRGVEPHAAPAGRRPQDLRLVIGGLVTLLVTSLLATADRVSALEEGPFRFVNEWPDGIEPPLWAVMQAGSAVAIVVGAAAAMFIARQRRWAAALLLAGWSAWVAAKIIKDVVARERPAGLLADVIERPEWEGLGFVSGHAAVVFALVSVSTPYVARSWRIVLWAIAIVTAVTRVYTGAHLPLDVIGGAALGVMCGGIVNLALGVPVRSVPDDALVETTGV